MAAVDPQTVEVKIPKAVSPQVFLSVMSNTIGAVVEKAVVEANAGADFGESWLNDHSAGTGPFTLNKWDRSVSITMDANPGYWGTAPAMKRIIMQNMEDAGNRQNAIETGDADIVEDLGSEQAAALDGNPDVKLENGVGDTLVYIGMNAMKPPFDKTEVREAVRTAINYDEIITLLGGNGQATQEIIPIGYQSHTGVMPFKPDAEAAKKLLAAAGVAEGTEVELLVPTGSAPGGIDWGTLAAKIQSDLDKVGLKVNLKQLAQSELLNIYRAQEWPDGAHPVGSRFPGPRCQRHAVLQLRSQVDRLAQRLERPQGYRTEQAGSQRDRSGQTRRVVQGTHRLRPAQRAVRDPVPTVACVRSAFQRRRLYLQRRRYAGPHAAVDLEAVSAVPNGGGTLGF